MIELLALAAAALVGAQDVPPGTGAATPPAPAFEGSYAGVEAGLHEHHFFLETTDRDGRTDGRYYRSWGVGGGAFVGHDIAVAPRVRVGVEAGVSVGGTTPVARFAEGTFAQTPLWGYRVTGRVGYVIGNRTMVYGTFGYGGHRYRIDDQVGVADAREWGSSFTIGAGVEHRLSRRIGLRLDFRHLDNQMSHLLVGIPIRF